MTEWVQDDRVGVPCRRFRREGMILFFSIAWGKVSWRILPGFHDAGNDLLFQSSLFCAILPTIARIFQSRIANAVAASRANCARPVRDKLHAFAAKNFFAQRFQTGTTLAFATNARSNRLAQTSAIRIYRDAIAASRSKKN